MIDPVALAGRPDSVSFDRAEVVGWGGSIERGRAVGLVVAVVPLSFVEILTAGVCLRVSWDDRTELATARGRAA